MERKSVNQWMYIFFTGYILLQVFFILFGKDNFEILSFENIRNYQTARFSFTHPELYFDTHRNPFYIFLLSPFTLFGYKIAQSFNLIVSVLILLLSVQIANQLYRSNSLFTVVLIAFSPVYFYLSTTCLPELLFLLLLVAGIYFIQENKHFLSALIVSFIPFAFPAGILIIAVFAFVFLFLKSFRSIIFLLTGTLVFSVSAYFITGDFLWLVHYLVNSGGTNEITFSALIGKIGNDIGIPLAVLFIVGLVIWLTDLPKMVSPTSKKTVSFLLIAGNFLVLFLGMLLLSNLFNSEFLSVVFVPLTALTAMKAFDFLTEKIRSENLANVILIGVISVQMVLMFTTYTFPMETGQQEKLMIRTSNYIKNNQPDSKIFYSNPLVVHYLDLDPLDTTQCRLLTKKESISDEMNWNDLLVWDMKIAGGKYNISIENIENDPYLEKLESFYLHDRTVKVNESDMSVHIFRKSMEKKTPGYSDHYNQTLSFEDYIHPKVKEIDGVKAWELDSTQEYSPNIIITADVLNRKDTFDFSIWIEYKANQIINKEQVLLVFSLVNSGQSIHYEKADIITSGIEWEQLKFNVKTASDFPETSKIQIYVWNKGRKNLFIKNINTEVKAIPAN